MFAPGTAAPECFVGAAELEELVELSELVVLLLVEVWVPLPDCVARESVDVRLAGSVKVVVASETIPVS